MDMQNEAAAALSGQQPQPAKPPGNAGGLGELAQAYARCEQTQSCTPQDAQILAAGLPQLVQMAKNVQMILQHVQGQQPQQGQQP